MKLPLPNDFPFKQQTESCLMWLVIMVVGPVIVVKGIAMLWSLLGSSWPYAVAVLAAIGLFGIFRLVQWWRWGR